LGLLCGASHDPYQLAKRNGTEAPKPANFADPFCLFMIGKSGTFCFVEVVKNERKSWLAQKKCVFFVFDI
jgi:hypothetical protein